MNTISISKLAERTLNAQIELGIRQDTVWHNYHRAIAPIVRLHLEQGKEHFDYGIINEHIRSVEAGLAEGKYSLPYDTRLLKN